MSTSTSDLDQLITISCGFCGMPSPLNDWCEAPISGPLPRGTYQCPKCGKAFKREPQNDIIKPMRLVEVERHL
jgi:endogenous inhibitor of DNA gyrase (YacG/DUF329 family)